MSPFMVERQKFRGIGLYEQKANNSLHYVACRRKTFY